MHRAINKQRIQQIRKLLLTLLLGEGPYQIERSKEDDEIEALLVTLNLTVEEMSESLRYYAFLNPHDTTKEYVNLLFVLDATFQVQYTNPDVCTLLKVETDALLGRSFSSLLTPHSVIKWNDIAHDLICRPGYHGIHSLTFQVPGGFTKTSTCAISLVYFAPMSVSFVLVTTFETSLKSLFLEDKFKKDFRVKEQTLFTTTSKKLHILSNEMDIRAIQKVRDYILQELEQPLPNLKALAHKFGINEFKLKKGFNQLYGTSVFRFLTHERLKRASLYLQNTSLPVKTISKMVGFRNDSHFSKAFRKRYGMRPLDLRKE